MNVYKIRDSETPYAGGMALVAAHSLDEALEVFSNNSINVYSDDTSSFTVILLNSVKCITDKPHIITEEFYYE